jgi:hypothetical protein
MSGFHTPIYLVNIPKPRSPFDKVLLSIAEGLRANGILEYSTAILG